MKDWLLCTTPQVQTGDEQPIIEILQVFDDVLVDEVSQLIVEQPVVQPVS